MAKEPFVIEPHFRLQEWVAEEKGYFKDEGLDYVFQELIQSSDGKHHDKGDKIGTVEDIVLDKQSNQIMFAALGFGGVFGVGEKYYPVPWSMLDYNEDKGGYVVPLNQDSIQNAPSYDLKDLTKHDGSLGGIREKTYSYYNVGRDWQ